MGIQALHMNPLPKEVSPPLEIAAQGLTLRTGRGTVYENVDLSLAAGCVAAIMGPSGSGRTALLLTLAGRMKPTAGSAVVCGFDLRREARRVRRVVGLGIFPGVNDLDDTTSIQAQVKSELTLHRLPHDSQAVHRLLERFGVEARPHDEIGSLSRPDHILLGVGLGLLHGPRVLMVDDADLNLTVAERIKVWRTLRGLGDEGLTVLTACVEPPNGGYADFVFDMGALR